VVDVASLECRWNAARPFAATPPQPCGVGYNLPEAVTESGKAGLFLTIAILVCLPVCHGLGATDFRLEYGSR
jgi:hypothetical protein